MKAAGGGGRGRAGRAPSTEPSTTTAARTAAATRANATTRALGRSGRDGLVAAVASSAEKQQEEQTAAQSCRASLRPCSAGWCGCPSRVARRGRSGSSHRRSPCALCTAAAGPGLQAATLSTTPGGVLPASAWHPDSTGGVKRPLLVASTGAPAGACWGVDGRTGVPASSRSRARSASVEGPAEAGDNSIATNSTWRAALAKIDR